MGDVLVINLFIDTNIWLAMFHLSKDDLKELDKLSKLINREIRLFISEQVRCEYIRNRDAKIKDALDKFKLPGLQFPNLVKCYDEYDVLKEKYEELKKEHNKITEKITNDVLNQKTPADFAINNMFNATEIYECSDKIINKAKTRYDLGNPPGKKNSYGDAVNWEFLLDSVPQNEDLFFISDDKDYCSELSSEQFNTYLEIEWTEQKNSELHFYRSLHDFLSDKYKDYNVILEQNKEQLISDLYESVSFVETHRIISKLSDYSDWSQKNISDMCIAANDNTQINWIIKDADVFSFYKELVDSFNGEDENVAFVKKMLDE